MSSLGGASSNVGNDYSQLSEADKRELQQWAQNETQKASLQETIHDLTQMCFKKCIPVGTRISSAQLDRTEEPCVQNCVARFMDANMLTLRNLEKLRQS